MDSIQSQASDIKKSTKPSSGINMDKTEGVMSVKDKINRELSGDEHYDKQGDSALLRKGADPYMTYRKLARAIWDNDKHRVKDLLEEGADQNMGYILKEATFRGNTDMVKLLLDNGANVNKGNPVEVAARYGHPEVVRLLLDKGADVNMEILVEGAAWRGDKDIVTILLEKGADIDK